MFDYASTLFEEIYPGEQVPSSRVFFLHVAQILTADLCREADYHIVDEREAAVSRGTGGIGHYAHYALSSTRTSRRRCDRITPEPPIPKRQLQQFPITIHPQADLHKHSSPSNKSPHCILSAIPTGTSPAPPTTYTNSVSYQPTSATRRTGVNLPRISSTVEGKSPSKNSTRSEKPRPPSLAHLARPLVALCLL